MPRDLNPVRMRYRPRGPAVFNENRKRGEAARSAQLQPSQGRSGAAASTVAKAESMAWSVRAGKGPFAAAARLAS